MTDDDTIGWCDIEKIKMSTTTLTLLTKWLICLNVALLILPQICSGQNIADAGNAVGTSDSQHHHEHKHRHVHQDSTPEERREACKELRVEYKVVPFQSWGTLPDDQKKRWGTLECDKLWQGTLPLSSVGHKKRVHHHHHHNITNTPGLLFDASTCRTCVVEMLHMDVITSHRLTATLSRFEHANNANITYVVVRTSANQTAEQIGTEIDTFTLTRPWWVVELEPYAWFSWKRDTILLLVPEKLTTHLKEIAKYQFLPEAQCESTPLLVSNNEADTWGNRLMIVDGMQWHRFPEVVFHVMASSDGRDGYVIFAEPDLCPGVTNKWQCLFLPVSNCSLPTDLVNCKVSSHLCVCIAGCV